MINFRNIDEVIKYLTNYNGEVKKELLEPVLQVTDFELILIRQVIIRKDDHE